MTGAAFEVSFDDAALMGGLDRLAAGLADTGPLLTTLGEYGVTSTKRRFDTQAGPDGSPWAALTPAYAEIKSAMGGLSQILRFHGYLADSQHYITAPGEVSWGSGMIYAAAQQFGATIVPKQAKALAFVLGDIFVAGHSGAMGKTQGVLVRVKSVTLPARPYLGLSAEDAVAIPAIARDYVAGLLGG